ncbi:hypothetical protein RN001_006380 [Aquatica leii]|uniref:Uncharacterized protein n=1 Tax=Aquatica leii TaxID=1421715 RepID=A0AAN7PIH1_9COLE|nr:hypothetical protein RN001_006380 [Aquatica leii]
MSDITLTNNDPILEHNLQGHKKQVLSLSFNPINKQLASCGNDHSVMLWRIAPNNIRCYGFKGHTDVVTSVCFSSNGRYMASSSQDNTVRLWVPIIKGPSTPFKAHGAAVRTVCFSPSNEQLLTGSNDKSLKLWNVQHRRFLTSMVGHTNWIRCAKYSPDGQIIASCADDKSLRIWDASSGQCIHTFTIRKGTGTHVDFHQSGISVALATTSGSVQVYDIRNNKIQQHYVLHDNATCVVWHPYANYFLSSGLDSTIKIVDALEGRPLYTLQGHTGAINTVNFSTDGDQFVSGGSDSRIMVWSTNFVTKDGSSFSSASTSSQVSVE